MASEGDYLENKSDTNFKAANLLLDQNMYCSSVHCYYYSCIQRIISKLLILYKQEEMNQERQSLSASSHVYYTDKIERTIKNELGLSNEAERIDLANFINNIKYLKRIRVQADYKDVEIKSDQGKKAFSYAESIHKYIKKKIG